MTDQPHAEPTPGPWFVENHKIWHEGGLACIAEVFAGILGGSDSSDLSEAQEANARLIAAAPATAAERDRLVKALEDIVKGTHRCKSAGELFAWAQNIARAVLDEAQKS